MSAMQQVTKESYDYSSIKTLAETALQFDIYQIVCGNYEVELEFGEGADENLLSIDLETKVVTFQPLESAIPGVSE